MNGTEASCQNLYHSLDSDAVTRHKLVESIRICLIILIAVQFDADTGAGAGDMKFLTEGVTSLESLLLARAAPDTDKVGFEVAVVAENRVSDGSAGSSWFLDHTSWEHQGLRLRSGSRHGERCQDGGKGKSEKYMIIV